MAAPLLRRGIGLLGQRVAQRQRLRVDLAVEDLAAFLRHGGEQLVGRIGEQPHALLDQLVGHRIERNAGAAEIAEHALRIGDIVLQRVGELAVVAERIHGRDRHGVDGVGPDQLLDIEHVAIGLVLGAGGGPQQPLRLGAFRGQRLPARAVEQPLVALIGELGVGDGDLALERLEARFLVRIVGLRDLLVEQFVDRGVDAADEEARHAGDLRNVAALGGQRLEAGQIGFDHLLVDRLREQQRDIDVDAVGDQIADRRQPFRRGRHLDHQVLAADLAPQPLGFVDGALGVLGEIGRDFDADIAVGAMGRVDRSGAARRSPAGCPRPPDARRFRRRTGPAPAACGRWPSSYSSEWPMACSKIDGFDVTPRRPSSSTSFFKPPLAMKPRDRKSSQTAWP